PAYEDVGVRALVGFAMMDRPLVDTFPFADTLPHDLCERLRALPRPTAIEYLALVNEVAATRHPKTRRVGVLVAPSAPQRCSQEFLVACAGLADELDLPIITHVQETRLQVVTGLEFYGSPIVEYLARIKFLGPRTTLIHAVWLNPREIRALADTGATAQYNPWSNQTLGSGLDFAMVAGEVMLRDGRFTRVDEARLLAEIETEVAGLAAQFAAADASVAPVRAAIETVYRRSLAASVPPDTYPARLPCRRCGPLR